MFSGCRMRFRTPARVHTAAGEFFLPASEDSAMKVPRWILVGAALAALWIAPAPLVGQAVEPPEGGWRGWLQDWRREYVGLEHGDRAERAALTARIEQVQDPAALRTLDALLEREKNHEVRALYARAVGNIEGEEALELLVRLAVQDESEYVRKTAAERLGERDDRHEAMERFLRYLRQARYCDIAARALLDADMIPKASRYELPDRKLFLALTGSLVAFEQRVMGRRKGYMFNTHLAPNGKGGVGRYGWYQEFPIYYFANRPLPHKNVLLALTRLTGENYGYNRDAWVRWYDSQKHRVRDRP
jgi:hypothetical protein